MKILIDPGASNSIINPDPANRLFSEYIYKSKFSVKSIKTTYNGNFSCKFPILKEFGILHTFDMFIVPWHERFDALIGSQDFEKLKALIDYENHILKINNVKIPFYFEINPSFFTPYSELLSNPILNIPVNIDNAPVIIPEIKLDDIFIPECISYAHEGYCQIPIEQNISLNNIYINFHEPVRVQPLSKFQEIKPEFYSTNNIDISKFLRTDHLNPEEKNSIMNLCKKFKNVFYTENSDLSFTHAVKHHIRTVDEIPIYQKSYRYPYHLKQEIQEQIQKLLDNKIIKPSISPYSFPVWIVPKKIDASGKKKFRMVIDYRKLNEKTIEDKYPLPRIDEILDNLGRCTYFSTLDLAQGFHQIEIHPESAEKTAFTVDNGHYEYTRMPFGLKNAPATFQRVMDTVLRPYLYKFCFVYMDDIVIFSKSLQDHIFHIKQIFTELEKYNLKIQLDKSEFLRKEVAFLGHVITPDGIKPNPDKIRAIQNFPLPKTDKQIKSFLGMLSYYRKFIKNFAKITHPINKYLKKGIKLDLNDPEYLDAFEKCKQLLCNSPVLAYPDFSKTFTLTTDASNIAIGSVLSQDSHPIAFHSRTLNSAERNYGTIEKELLAIIDSCKHFRPYLFSTKFIIETDHRPLVWLHSLREPNQRLIRWKLKLEEFDFEIRYKKGKENYVADALSRIELNALDSKKTDKPKIKIISNDIIVPPKNTAKKNLDIPKKDYDDIDLLSLLPRVNSDSNLSLTFSEADEILNSELKSIDLDLDDQRSKASGETRHSSKENPIFGFPISDKSLNTAHFQIILKYGDKNDIDYTKPFGKNRY